MQHFSNWIAIPVLDIDRAAKFYSEIFGGLDFHPMAMSELEYALFPSGDRYNASALVEGEYHKPSADGVTIYLDGGKDLNVILHRVGKAGGTVVMEKTYLGEEAGCVGMLLDSEGNKIGLQHT